ncbi:MAG: hypothetical protein U5R06_14110 [candidate division KSB1 bacterium]|nr:hypothetical protein [candidate division KSB1 bacterium]
MRKLQFILPMLLLLMTSLVFSQTLDDFVDQVRGDTLVIKDFFDMGEEQNSLYQALTLDTDAPEGRVYMLKTNGYYPLVNSPTTQMPTVIVGEDDTRLVQNDDAAAAPPLVCGAAWEGGSNTGSISHPYDLTLKNINIVPASAKADLGWSFSGPGADGVTLDIENCMFERTRWVFMNTGSKDVSFKIKDSYFVNMVGQPCRRNGGVMDVFNTEDTLLVENPSHTLWLRATCTSSVNTGLTE